MYLRLSYELEDQWIGIGFPDRGRDFSLLNSIQTLSRAYSTSYTVNIRGCFPGEKVTGHEAE
jgi:hypothetical protein